MAERGALTNLAYRVLGSLTEAEDAVQDAYVRWFALTADERAAITSPGAWLNTVTSRICFDTLRSSRVRRERYVGHWLPEPLPDPTERADGRASLDPADHITLDESVDMAFLVLLDAMTPAERVSFLLHDVFGYPFAEIASIVGRTPAACRQLASSARGRVRQTRPVGSPAAERAAVVRRFKVAWRSADVSALVELLDPSVVAVADGGGNSSAALRPIEGSDRVARFFAGLSERMSSLTVLERTVNGQPGLVTTLEGKPMGVASFEIVGGRIRRIWVVTNHEKLGAWAY
jgi:RNA polymerase sigma-70 factor (ECF subfamily)